MHWHRLRQHEIALWFTQRQVFSDSYLPHETFGYPSTRYRFHSDSNAAIFTVGCRGNGIRTSVALTTYNHAQTHELAWSVATPASTRTQGQAATVRGFRTHLHHTRHQCMCGPERVDQHISKARQGCSNGHGIANNRNYCNCVHLYTLSQVRHVGKIGKCLTM